MQCSALNIKQLQNKFGCILFAELRRWDTRALYHESSDSFVYPQKTLLNLSHPKNTWKFSYPKNSWNRKFKTQKHPSIIQVTLNAEYPRWVHRSDVVLFSI